MPEANGRSDAREVDGNRKLVQITSHKDGESAKDMYSFEISKELVDEGIKNLKGVVKIATEKVVGNIGVGAAAGTAAATAFKSTAGLPPAQRVIVTGAVAGVTAAGTKVGIGIGDTLIKHININEAIKNSQHADPHIDRIPSPDPNIINSPLENDITSPLQDLLLYSFILDILILIVLISILVIIFNRYIVKYNLTLINYIINKYIPIKIRNWFNINIGIDFNNTYVLFIFIIITILLCFFILLKLLIISILLVDIDRFINGHLYIHGGDHKSSIVLFISSLGGIRTRSLGLTNRFNYNNVPFLQSGVKYFRYLSTNMPNKDFNNLLTIPFDQRFGQYQDYLSKKKKN